MEKNGKSRKFWIIACVILGLLSLGSAAVFLKSKKQGENWQALKVAPIVDAIYGISTVVARDELHVKTGVATTVNRIFVHEGAKVQKGEPLIQLSDQPSIRAPFSGTVTHIPFHEGENVFPQMEILTFVNVDHLYLSMPIEQSSALRIRPDQQAVVMFESQKNSKFTGKVRAIVPKQGQFEVHILMEKMPEGALPGMTADTSVVVGQKEKAVLIPNNAIQSFQAKFRLKNKILKKEVKLGIVGDLESELLEPIFENPEQVEVLNLQ